MRIGMMADLYMTTVSGVTNSLTLSKRWLENLGHEVYIFTFGDDEVIDNEKNIIRTSGVPVVDTGFYLNLRYNKGARQLLYTMDIAHVHHPFVSGSLAMRYCVPRNIPIVFTNHTRYDLITQAYIPILPESIGDAALKAYLSPFYRTAFGFNEGHVISTYIGRLSPEKNLSLLIRAFYGMAMTYDHVRLLIVGDGPERENLETQIKHMKIADKVYFTGMVEYESIPAYLAACDIFVTPSSSETFGLSTVEAMAAGLPVLGMDAPGSRDIIEDGITGLITPDDVAVFTGKLILLSTDLELRKRMRKQALHFTKKYDIQTKTNTLLGP